MTGAALSETKTALSKKYVAYPEYKDSGIEWLGRIPSEWRIIPLKHLAELTPKKSKINKEKMSELCSFIPMEKLKLNNLELDETKQVSEVYDGYTYFEDGDVLLAKVTPCFENKNMAVAKNLHNGIGFGSSEIYVLRTNSKLNNQFLFYRLQEDSFMDIATAAMSGAGGLKRVPAETINTYVAAFPTYTEQQKIANFLDHETTMIDTLIAKQEKLIELLKEKRQAVISHTVTKGISYEGQPNAPMNDSGVEWLGQVPEHWVVTPIRNLIRSQKLIIQDGNHGELHPVAVEYVDDGIPFLMANNIRNGIVDLSNCKKISHIRAESLRIGFAKSGDMLLTHKGTVGEVGFVPQDIREPYWMLTPQVTYYRWAEDKFNSKYFGYQFQSKSISIQLELMGGKQSTRAYVGLIAQADLVIVIPPLNEQNEIVRELNIRCKASDLLLEKSYQLIDLLKKRKTALVSAAVTGKIDVREWKGVL
jgi:type I restriction enzyme S subunit